MRPLLEPVHERERKSNAGRKPFDVVLMFNLLILQTLYNLADEQVDYQIRDRLSFARCLGLGIEDGEIHPHHRIGSCRSQDWPS